ncbi:MAG: GNAT family N-acetyltransferase [Christensenellales bacterium]
MDLVLRTELPGDWRAVEALTREAFWNVHEPGCSEHLLMHKLRQAPAFIRELSVVALYQEEIVGHIAYSRAKIVSHNAEGQEVLCFGPLSVLPAYQKRGIGTALVEHTKLLAQSLGYGAILIYGDPRYYCRLGFVKAENFRICTPDHMYADALQACELYPGALANIRGAFHEDAVFQVTREEADLFDRGFPPKVEGFLPSQARFREVVALRRPADDPNAPRPT